MSARRCLQRGITLVELIVFIVVVSVGIAGYCRQSDRWCATA